MHDGLGQPYASLKTFRQRFNGLFADCLQRYFSNNVLDSFIDLFASKASDLSNEPQKLDGSHIPV